MSQYFSSAGRVVRTHEPVACTCGALVTIRTAWTSRNYGRRFYMCIFRSQNRNEGCKYFDWIDPSTASVASEASSSMHNTERRRSEAESNNLQIELVRMEAENAELRLLLAESKSRGENIST